MKVSDNKSVLRNVLAKLREFNGTKNKFDGREVSFSREYAGKIVSQSGTDALAFAPLVKQLFESAVPAWYVPEQRMPGHTYHPDVEGYQHYVAKFKTNEGREFYVRFTVREQRQGGYKGVHAATVSEVSLYAKNQTGDTSLSSLSPAARDKSILITNQGLSLDESQGLDRPKFHDAILARFLGTVNGEFLNAPPGSLRDAVFNARGFRAAELAPVEGAAGVFRVPALDGVTVTIGDAGIEVAGLTPAMLLKSSTRNTAAALLANLNELARKAL